MCVPSQEGRKPPSEGCIDELCEPQPPSVRQVRCTSAESSVGHPCAFGGRAVHVSAQQVGTHGRRAQTVLHAGRRGRGFSVNVLCCTNDTYVQAFRRQARAYSS